MSRKAKKTDAPASETKAVVPAKRSRGRPSTLEIEPDLIKKLRHAILMGAPILTAAALNDVSYEVMRKWVMKGKEDPSSEYGQLVQVLTKAVAEYELRDIGVIDQHAFGRPAQYAMQPVRNKKGEPVMETLPNGQQKPLMEYVRDAEGNPILLQSEIKSDWRAAMERLSRRMPKKWARQLNIDLDAVLTFDNKEREVNPKEAMSFEQRIAEAVKELEDEV